MWIRSQDKEKLADLRIFDISKSGYINLPYKLCGYSDDWANINNFHIDLGYYSSKTKAIKVLDMIHDFIQNDGCFSIGYDVVKKYVFKMPHDDEVEY